MLRTSGNDVSAMDMLGGAYVRSYEQEKP